MIYLIVGNILQQPTVPQAVYTIWAITLAIVVLVIVPLAIYLLHRTYAAARSIERYFAEMAEAGVGIAENTSHVQALEDTIAIATKILGVAGNINSHSDTIKVTLAGRAANLNGNGKH
ncbi:MAG: hypothetical protein AAF702_27675 [Chloroflexota bacterium]